MPQGSKKKYTEKQKRRAKHIEDSVKDQGKSKKEAERIAYATINKEESGGKKKGGSGRSKKDNRSASHKGGKKGGKKSSTKKSA